MLKPRRRQVYWSLALVAALALPCVTWTILHSRGRDEAAFQLKLSRWGGRSQPILDIDSPFAPLRKILGAKTMLALAGSKGRIVSAWESDATKGQLAELLEFQPLMTILAGGAKRLGDDWVAGIEPPGSVRMMMLDATAVTDRSVDAILRLKNLEILGLAETEVSDSAVDRLQLLPSLKRLYVGGPKIKAVRLIEVRVVENPPPSGMGRFHLEGRIEVDGKAGRPGLIFARCRFEGEDPGWMMAPYGAQARGGDRGDLAETSPGVWTFRVDLPRTGHGRSDVELTIGRESGARPALILYEMPPVSVEIPAQGDGDPRPIE